MKIVKLYRRPNNPEFFALIRSEGTRILVNYPINVAYRKRSARWLDMGDIRIDWIKEFSDASAD